MRRIYMRGKFMVKFRSNRAGKMTLKLQLRMITNVNDIPRDNIIVKLVLVSFKHMVYTWTKINPLICPRMCLRILIVFGYSLVKIAKRRFEDKWLQFLVRNLKSSEKVMPVLPDNTQQKISTWSYLTVLSFITVTNP